MAGYYEEWLGKPGVGPAWMHDPVGNAYWRVVGRVLDQQADRLKTGLRCRFPEDAAALGMADALELIGRDRMLPRGGSTPALQDEALVTWAARLQKAWDAWRDAGTAVGLLTNLKVAGFPSGAEGCLLVNHIGRAYTLNEDGTLAASEPAMACENRTDKTGAVPATRLHGFTLSAIDQFYSCFILIFLQDVEGLENTEGNVIKARLNKLVREWRQGGAIYMGASICPTADDAAVWDWPNDLVWDQEGLVWGDNNARFIDPE